MTDALALASVHLGWSPADFNAATPREFWAALNLLKSNREAQRKEANRHGRT